MRPKISIIMSVYNEERHLRASIESILNQTFTDFEFIIVNDGSTDASLEIIKSYADARIQIINNEENIGLTKSLNKAIKKARGEYIARQDADDISLPDRFEAQLKYLAKHPKTALLGTSIYVINEKGKMMKRRIALPSPGKALFKGNRFFHGSLIIKKDIIDELGPYNEQFKYSQDYELVLRISRIYDTRNLTTPLYKLRFHDKSITSAKRKEQKLYGIFAQKLAKNELDNKSKEAIEKNIPNLYPFLTTEEKVSVRKAVAYIYLENNNLELAKREYREIFRLKPSDFENILHLILSYFGIGTIRKSYQVGRFLRHALYIIFGFAP